MPHNETPDTGKPSRATRIRQAVIAGCAIVSILCIGMAFNPEFGHTPYFIVSAVISGAISGVIGFRMILRGE